MIDRSLITWFMWCSLAGFGVVLPLAIGQNPEHEFLVQSLRALGCLGFLVGMVSMIRSSGVRPPPGQASEMESEVPRTLCNNPLAAAHGALPLTDRMDMAVEASASYGRAFGVVCYRLAAYDRIARLHGVLAADSAMRFVLAMSPMVLRHTDRIESVGRGRFVVCAPLLPDLDTLHTLRDRISRAMNQMRLEALQGASIEYASGLALYPAHGKTGAELLAHAQQQCDAAYEQRFGAATSASALVAREKFAA